MTERTNALIGELAQGLRPVRRLPALRRVAAVVIGAGLGLAAINVLIGWFAKEAFRKPDFAPIDALTLAAHALLAGGALAFALAACVPGRERPARGGALALLIASVGLAGIGLARFADWPGVAALAPTWLERTFACALGCFLPAVVPAFLLARFAASAAPRRAALVLLVGGVASLALLSAPGVVGCEYPDELHHALGHALTPLYGAALLGLAMLPVYLSARRSSEV
jgi:hypothetical protein